MVRGHPRRTAVRQHDQRRSLTGRGGDRGVGRRVVPAVDRSQLAVPGHRLSDRDRLRVQRQLARGTHCPPGAGRQRTAGETVRPVRRTQDDHHPLVRHRDRLLGERVLRQCLELAVGEVQQHDRFDAVHDPLGHQPIVAEKLVRPVSQPPWRVAEVDGLRTEGPHALVGPGVQIPPPGLLGEEDQPPVVRPAGSGRRGAWAAGHLSNALDPPVDQESDHDRRFVPGHVRVVPLRPGQPVVVGELRSGVEVGALAEHVSAVRIVAVEVQGDDRGDRFCAGTVVLPHGQHQVALRMQPEIGVAERLLRGDRLRLRAAAHHVQPAVAQLREDDHAAGDGVLSAAVLVHPAPHVPRGRRHLHRLTVVALPPQTGPAVLVGARLQPVEPVPSKVGADSPMTAVVSISGLTGEGQDPYGAVITGTPYEEGILPSRWY